MKNCKKMCPPHPGRKLLFVSTNSIAAVKKCRRRPAFCSTDYGWPWPFSPSTSIGSGGNISSLLMPRISAMALAT